MTDEMWLGLWLGGGLGVAYIAMSYLTSLLATRQGGSQFVKIYIGGMVVRMLTAMGVIFLVLSGTSVDHLVFLGTFLIIFVIGMAREVIHQHSGSKDHSS